MGYRLGKSGLLLVYALLILVPLIAVVLTSLKTNAEVYRHPLGLPASLQWHHYTDLFFDQSMGIYFKNSVIVTFVSVTLTLFLSSLIAFSITRMSGKRGQWLFLFFTLGLFVPAQVNMIPLYAMMADWNLTNSLLGLILVNTASTLSVGVFILTGFMKTIPKELFEAGTMDGAGNWRLYRHIGIPVSLPSLAATAIFLFVMHWNDLLYPLLLVTRDEYKTLPLALLQFQGEYTTQFPLLFTGVLIASAPMILIYVFLQRYFVMGVTAGSVKG